MFSKSSAVLLLVALCAFQGTSANVIDDIISNMSDAVNKTVTAVKEKIAEFESAAENIMDSVEEKIQEAEQQASEAMKATIEKAQQLGANITECVNTADEAIQKAANSSVTTLRACAADARQAMQPDIDELDSDVQQAQALASQAAKNFSACGLFNVICQGKAIAAAAQGAASIGSKVAADSVSMAKDLPAAQADIFSCAQEDVTAAVSTIQAVSQQEAQCIQQKIQDITQQ